MTDLCTCSELQKTRQAKGPHRPTGKVLGYILEDVIDSGCEIESVAINGQTGVIYISTYKDGKKETVKFKLRGISDVI